MNPPFSDRRDGEHIKRAYALLNPGGRIVALAGEGVFFGSDKRASAFRAWMDEVGATDEKLEEGTFQDPSLPVSTGVNARMIVIDKPGNYSVGVNTKQAYESRIDELFDGAKADTTGVTMLDSSDVMSLFGYEGLLVELAEGKVHQYTHNLNAEDWKKIPYWLENPVAVFDSDSRKDSLVFIAPELKDGQPIIIAVEPNFEGSKRKPVHLMVSAYTDKGIKKPYSRWVRDGGLKYLDRKKSLCLTGNPGFNCLARRHRDTLKRYTQTVI